MGIPYAEVIGDPIAHSKSPLIHKFWLSQLGLEGEYKATHVRAGELAGFLETRRRDRNWRGCNLTMPHKQAVLPLLDERHDFDTGAVNCVFPAKGRLIGHNTDVDGLEAALPVPEWDLPVCVIGAGGAASAVPCVVDWTCVFHFNVIVRDPGKGRAFLERLNMHGAAFSFDEAAEAMRGTQGVVNATPLGMTGFPRMPASVLAALSELPPRGGWISRGGWVVDMVYTPVATELLLEAGQLGLSTGDGLTVLVGQAAASFRHFFGRTVAEPYLTAVRELLTS
jgi:shikimate dehydrogenase